MSSHTVFERFISQTGHRLCDTSACFSKLLQDSCRLRNLKKKKGFKNSARDLDTATAEQKDGTEPLADFLRMNVGVGMRRAAFRESIRGVK